MIAQNDGIMAGGTGNHQDMPPSAHTGDAGEALARTCILWWDVSYALMVCRVMQM